jgi:hypothetical protein
MKRRTQYAEDTGTDWSFDRNMGVDCYRMSIRDRRGQ